MERNIYAVKKRRRRKSRTADLCESIFDLCYLAFAIGTGLFLQARAGGRILPLLGASLALVLGLGDAFHLLPRVRRGLIGEGPHTQKALGAGLFVSSVTMTVFYILLYYFWRAEFPIYANRVSGAFGVLIWVTAIIRIVICFFPQNNWMRSEGNMVFSFLRNAPFVVTGICTAALYFITGNSDGNGMQGIGTAIIVSFCCYLPVVIFSKKHPMVGILMIPKTCAYIAMLILIRNASF